LTEFRFPFERCRWYPIRELRIFERELSEIRLSNSVFSNKLRCNGPTWAKLWNEELVPISLLVDWHELSDSLEFQIAGGGDPMADLYLRFSEHQVGFQITVADVDWNGDGGRTWALENQALANGMVAWGGGGTSKKNYKSKVESVPVTISHEDRVRACTQALAKALQRKTSKPEHSDCLLIYSRGAAFQLFDEGYGNVLGPLLAEPHYGSGFRSIWAVDGSNGKPVAIGHGDTLFPQY
jgi:hypothetical protein